MSGQEDSGRVPGIAVLGLSGRFPGAGGPSEFWANLRAGRESVPVPAERPWPDAGGSVEAPGDTASGDVHGRLDDVTGFDAACFGMSESAANLLHPQQRIFLECAWEAFEHAGYVGQRVSGPVAVFAAPGPSARHLAGDRDGLATLVSSTLNLTGPSIDVQTGGGSSLVAVHLACQSLLNGECDMALAGSSTVYSEPERPANAVMASAVACVVLKRLEDAQRDGDQILAVIRGSAINNTGARRAGDAAPGLAARVRAVGEALAIAGVRPDEVSYIEADGAATPGGDPIEIVALTKAFRADTAETQFCAVGTVRGNIGDAGETAGLVGLVKVILALQHREIPATVHAENTHPEARFEASPFYVNTALCDWAVPAGRRRIAGVTAFGEGGTNVHLIVEEAPEPPPAMPSRDHHALVLSANTLTALERATENLAAHLGADNRTALADVAYTLIEGRQPMIHRRVVIARDATDAAHALHPAEGSRVITDTFTDTEPPPLAWMFPGSGPYGGMGAGLYAGERIYRQALDEALSGLEPNLEAEVRRVVRPPDAPATGLRRLDEAPHTLPALVAVEYAIGRLLQAWGARPAAMIGDGPGEYAAACFAGVFDIQQAMALATVEGRLLPRHDAGTTPGAHGPALVPSDARDARSDEFARVCRSIAFKPPTLPLVSNVTGGWITGAEATDPNYWGRRLQRTSRIDDGLRTLLTLRRGVFVEIGPGRNLASLLAQQPNAPRVVAPTLRHPDDHEADVAFLLTALGRLWAAGVPVDAQSLFAGERRRRVALPTYPFERQRCSMTPAAHTPSRPAAALAKRSEVSDWFALPGWSRTARPPRASLPPRSWLVLTDDSPLAADLVAALRDEGHHVTAVVPGAGFALIGPDRFAVDPGARADYEALAAALGESDRRPRSVLHLWAMAPSAMADSADAAAQADRESRYRSSLAHNYFSLIYLAQALAADAPALDVYCVSSQVQTVAPDDEVAPEKAVLLGPCAVIPREYPAVSCTSIDIDWPSTPAARSRLLHNLARELHHRPGDREIVFRGRDRWTRRYDAVPLPPALPQEWVRARGTYVVTGGPAGLALSIADHLAANGAARLAFIGRTPRSADVAAAGVAEHRSANELNGAPELRRLRAAGAEVLHLAADVGDRAAMRRALTEVRTRFGAIHGVFHAAGTLQQEIIALSDGSIDTPVLEANFKAALVLDELFSETAFSAEPPELFVLFSSVSALLGLPGQVEYTAATAALDRLAHARSRRASGRTLSINWSAWREVGVLADLVRAQHEIGHHADTPWHGGRSRPHAAVSLGANPRRQTESPAEAALRLGITTAEGIEALDRILATDLEGQVIATAVPLDPWLERLRAHASRAADRDDGGSVDPAGSLPGGPSSAVSMPIEGVERELAAMWRAVLELDDVEGREDFFDLGGHSLSAVQLFRRIRDTFGVDLPLATLFEAPTIAELAVVVRDRVAAGRAGASATDPRTAAGAATARPASRSLVAVKHGAGRLPLFVVHGAGGHVLNIKDLARAMDPSQSVLGLQASGIDGVSALGGTIEQMAQTYLEEVRAVQAHGPYLLAGYSGGGVIAFEMARRLEAAGEAIGVLAFIDTFHPQMPVPHINVFTRLLRLRHEGSSYVRDALDRRRRSLRDERDWRRLEKHLAAGEPIPVALRELYLMRNFAKAASRYHPEPWPGRALLFRADQVDYYYRAGGPTYGWDKTVLGGIEIVPVPGDHHSIMLGANAARIARRLEQAIDEVTIQQDQDKRG